MSRKPLTARFCESIKVEARTDFWDDLVRGLVLRVSPTGAKSWSVVYTRAADGAKQRVTIGRFPAVGLEAARAKGLKLMSQVAEGGDPAGNKRASREAMTIDELADLYIEKYAKRQKKTWAEDERLLKVEVRPAIGRIKAVSVKKRDCLDIVEAKAEQGRETQARSIFALLRRLFNWAVENDYMDASPMAGAKAPGKPVRRDRCLVLRDIAKVFVALPDARLEPETKDIIRLLFLTGQRSGEVCGMRRGEIDLEAECWTLPAGRTKNGLAHVVPLVGEAFEIVRHRLTLCGSDLDAALFSHVAGQPIEPNAIAQAVRKKLQIFVEPWTPHDARRSAATGMAAIGIFPHVIEATLNHISGFRGGVAGTYNRNRYEPEKRSALIRWGSEVYSTNSEAAQKVVSMSNFPLDSSNSHL